MDSDKDSIRAQAATTERSLKARATRLWNHNDLLLERTERTEEDGVFCAVACLQPTVGTNLKVLPKTVH